MTALPRPDAKELILNNVGAGQRSSPLRQVYPEFIEGLRVFDFRTTKWRANYRRGVNTLDLALNLFRPAGFLNLYIYTTRMSLIGELAAITVRGNFI